MPNLPKIAFGIGKVSRASTPPLADWGFDKRDSLRGERLVDRINILNASAQEHPMTCLAMKRNRLCTDHLCGGGHIQQHKVLVFQPERDRIRVAKCFLEAKCVSIKRRTLGPVLYKQHRRVDLANHH